MSNLFTITIDNPGNLITDKLDLIRSGTEFALTELGRYLDWQGTLDITVSIRTHGDPQNPYPQYNGLIPSQPGYTLDASGRAQMVTLAEARTGIDPNGAKPDSSFTIYLGDDGTMRNYGFPVWLDPNPRHDVTPVIPAGHHDFVSVAIHELLHGFGFYYWPQAMTEFTRQVSVSDGVAYFTGANVRALVGGQGLPLAAQSDHYGNAGLADEGVSRGIMYRFGNYEQNRWMPGRLDLAVLADLGWTVKDQTGLPLVELDDRAPHVTGTAAADRIWGDFQNNRLDGQAGNDRLDGGKGDDTILGGDGLDIALFTGGTMGRTSDGAIQVTGPDGSDRVEGVEVLLLGNRTYFTSPLSTSLLSNPVDETLYLAANPDIAAAVRVGALTSGAAHWTAYGRAEGRAPSPFFDAAYYAGHNEDLSAAFGQDVARLLEHWLNYGIVEGRAASPLFDPKAYLALNPDVAAAGMNPLPHYLAYGIAEGRPVGADLSWFG